MGTSLNVDVEKCKRFKCNHLVEFAEEINKPGFLCVERCMSYICIRPCSDKKHGACPSESNRCNINCQKLRIVPDSCPFLLEYVVLGVS